MKCPNNLYRLIREYFIGLSGTLRVDNGEISKDVTRISVRLACCLGLVVGPGCGIYRSICI